MLSKIESNVFNFVTEFSVTTLYAPNSELKFSFDAVRKISLLKTIANKFHLNIKANFSVIPT